MLQELFVHYQSKAFQVIAINVEDQTISNDQVQLIADYCNEIGVTFPVLIDQGLQQFNHYTIKAVPTTFLINHKRTIIEKLAGYPISRRNQLTTTIKDIIQPAIRKGHTRREAFHQSRRKGTAILSNGKGAEEEKRFIKCRCVIASNLLHSMMIFLPLTASSQSLFMKTEKVKKRLGFLMKLHQKIPMILYCNWIMVIF